MHKKRSREGIWGIWGIWERRKVLPTSCLSFFLSFGKERKKNPFPKKKKAGMGDVKIYVLFYARESDEPMKGIMGFFQDKLQFWHCEIAFPLSCFDSSSLPAPPPGIPKESLIWAYGIMNQTREPLPYGQIVFQNHERIIIDPDVRNAAQSQRKYIQIDAGSKGISRSTTLIDENGGKSQYDVSKCVPKRWWGWGIGQTDPLTTWPTGKQVLGPAEVRVRKEDGLIQVVTPGTVFGKHRTFSRPNYKWITFLVPWSRASRAVQYCAAQVGKQYDHTGIKRSLFWPSRHSLHPDRLYCVNLVVTTLQQAGIAQGLNPTGITTDDLYRVLSVHPGTKVKTLLPVYETQFLEQKGGIGGNLGKGGRTRGKGLGERGIGEKGKRGGGFLTPQTRKKRGQRGKDNRARKKGSSVKMRTIEEVEDMV